MPVPVRAALLLLQLPGKTPGKAVENGQSVGILHLLGDLEEALAPSFAGVQLWPLWSFGEVNQQMEDLSLSFLFSIKKFTFR